MDWMARCIQGDGSDDRHLVLRATTCLASWTFSSKIEIIHLDFSLQYVALIPFAHSVHDLAVEHPGSVVSNAQLTTELQ